MVIKKLAIESNTPSEEVSLALASVEATLSRKSYEFTGINTDAIDSLADTLVKGKRKSFVSLSEALSSLKPTELKSQLLAACPTEKHLPIAENYLLKTLLDKLGFKTNLDPQTLADVYPNLKVTKPRGNFGKKKK
jgi:hypothetical protein